MNHLKSKTVESVNHLIDYFEAKWNVAALNISDRVARTLSTVLMGMCLMIAGFFVVVLLSISAALALGQWLGSMAMGFLLMAGFYLIICFVFVWFRKTLLFLPFVNYILKLLYKEDRDENKNIG